jgi:hypothetical protein
MRASRSFVPVALATMLLACGANPPAGPSPLDAGTRAPGMDAPSPPPASPAPADAASPDALDAGVPPPPRPHPRSAVPCDPLPTIPDTRDPQPELDHRFLPVTIDLDTQLDIVVAADIADMNGDGFGDLVVLGRTSVADGWDDRLLVYLQNACGSLNAPIIRPSGLRWLIPGGMVLTDVTGDGRVDVVLGHGEPIVYAQLPDGTLPDAPARVALGLPDAEVGDVTILHDERGVSLVFLDGPDIVVATRDAATGRFVENTRSTGAGYPDIASGDVTGDGRDDVLVMDRMRNAAIVQVFSGSSGYAFGDPDEHKARTRYATGFAVGDVSGDGRADVVLANGKNMPDSAIALFLQKDGALDEPLHLPSADSPGRVRLADIDGDGRADVVVDHGGRFGVYLGAASGALLPEGTYSCPARNASMAVGDVDGDGLPDVVRAGDRSIAVHLNAGHP